MKDTSKLSLQEAADILNVSHDYLVTLLERGEINFHEVGTNKVVMAKHVFEYKDRTTEQRYEVLEELTALSQDLGMGY